jgi:heparanase 1
MRRALWFILLLSVAASADVLCSAQANAPRKLVPSKMPKIATVDPRYLSYNIEMVEVMGGRFWAPYKSGSSKAAPKPPDPNQPAGIDPNLFQYRKPIDLSNPRLRKLAEALGPSYVRVSGTWANSSLFQDSDAPAPAQPPEGFRGVLTRAEWKGVIDFAHAADAQIVTSVAISSGVRDKEGVWTPEQAKLLFDYTRKAGGTIAATEFMNEPTIPGPGNAPKGYDAAAFARDAKLFEAFLRKESPKTVFLGPGGVGEGAAGLISAAFRMNLIKSDDILKDTGPIFDAFSYHFYGSVSKRCGGKMTVEKALTSEWLDATNGSEEYYAQLRDKYLPAKPMWLTETAEAACGGDALAAQYVDTFRFVNQLGTLAQKGVKVVMHNTLAASDYGLLDESTLEPRPDYWVAVLWKRLMGPTVLNPQAPSEANVRVYAQCLKGVPGGVALVAMNTDEKEKHSIAIKGAAEKYTITSDGLTSEAVSLNGTALKVAEDGSLPPMAGEHVGSGTLQLAPASVTFVAIPSAKNASCKVPLMK